MLFNSYAYILAFLPIVFIVYFSLNACKLIVLSKCWLVVGSLFFYSWWNVLYLPLILVSMVVNYGIGAILGKEQAVKNRKHVLIAGIVFNLGLLGFFKYSDFLVMNINFLFSADLPFLKLLLPLAISFYTFQQISYLVDAFRREAREVDPLNYVLFVTFFPQLIAGPIVHHQEMMPQFASLRNKRLNYKNISLGLFIFFIGLFKKVVIADTFAIWATAGFDHTTILTMIDAWIVSLSFTFQLYFDFSGYTDMAIGAALLFNIRLPINFNSPYKALDIQDFWRRWHMTLTRFMMRYLYIPLGGNRKGPGRTYVNILLVFLISGLWHGAGWTFVFWGFLHGAATMIHRYWRTFNIRMNKVLAWLITFNFVNISWVFFRAEEWHDAVKVLKGMFGLNTVQAMGLETIWEQAFFMVIFFLILTMATRNSLQWAERLKVNTVTAILMSGFITYLLFSLNKMTEFLYFNF